MNQDISKMNSIPVVWLVSTLKGVTQHTFTKPELKVDRILVMLSLGHENISEPFSEFNLGYVGTFDPDKAPF